MNSSIRSNSLSHALAAALLLALSACSGGASFFGTDANAGTTSAAPAVPSLTGSPMLDHAIRTGGDFEMVDSIRAEHVGNAQTVSRVDAVRQTGVDRQSSK